MNAIEDFEQSLNSRERKIMDGLSTPFKIQRFLDRLSYRRSYSCLSPLSVLRKREAHCFDGAVFGAAALQRIGHPPRITFLVAERDDDHILALFRENNCWGAVSKSNCSGLRFRDPVYRDLHELVMSYFPFFFNTKSEKSLHGYTVPLNLGFFNAKRWMTRDKTMDSISHKLDYIRWFRIASKRVMRRLPQVDRLSYRANFLDANFSALYKP